MADPLCPIRTEADHQAALAESERLDSLVTLINAWEDEYVPMDPPSPVEAI